MENTITQIKNMILQEIEPEKIYYHETVSLHLFVIVWDIEMSNSEKHIYIRKVLRSINIPFDITTYSSKGFQRAIKQSCLVNDVVKLGRIIYAKEVER